MSDDTPGEQVRVRGDHEYLAVDECRVLSDYVTSAIDGFSNVGGYRLMAIGKDNMACWEHSHAIVGNDLWFWKVLD